MKYIVEIPGCQPPSLNDWLGKKWQVRWHDKQGLEWMTIACARQDDALPLPIEARVDIWVTVFNRPREIDADNVPTKAFVDGLRYGGVLANDNRKHVRWAGSCCEQDDGEPRVVIEIEEVIP